MVVGTIIGASIFIQPSEITGRVFSVGGVFAVWLVAGLMTFFGALVCAEWASLFPQSGGVYVYLREVYSPAVGFLWGWAMFWSVHSGIIAAISAVFSRFVSFFIPLGSLGSKAVSIGIIAVLTAVNYRGVKQGSALQTFVTWAKVAAIVFLVIAGFALGSRLPAHFVAGQAGRALSFRDFFSAVAAGLFAFGGWHMVTYSAEETHNPRKTIPRALLAGTLIVTLCYVALNAVYMYILPLEEVASSSRIAADAADKLLGFGGGALMSGLVVFSIFGALSGIILSGPRVYFSMARDGLLFRWAGAIHPVFGTPHRAIVLQGVWSSVLVATGTYRALFTRVVYTEWIFFGLLGIGLFLFRRTRGTERGGGMWGYPVVPGLFVLASLAVVANQLVSDLGESLLGLSLVLAGWPVYHLWLARLKKERRP
jgi:APA family basic amino acid/polyamine antiporter